RPEHNVLLGGEYLNSLMTQYDGSLVLSAAAYNAGPGRVKNWIGMFGDPRAGGIDPLDWVELIPFSETRNYVQRVSEAEEVYRKAYSR
ncbi:MAG: transglycosylase SLT domain-containing protein, partial [Bdellovibrionales bacterium]